MQYAAKIVDTDVDTVIKSRQKLASAMGKELNSKDIQEAFQALRVPVYDNTTGKMRDMENVFWDVGAALMALPDEVQQNNIAMKLFGKSWMELRPMFDSGRKAYEDAMKEATVVPEENLKRLNELQDQLDKLDTEFQALKMNVLSELAPAFETLAAALTNLMAEFNAYLQTDEGQKMMEDLRQALAEFFDGIKNIDFREAVDKVKGGLEGVKGALDWIVKEKDNIGKALEGIGIAFAALKLATFAADLAKIVTGFRNLFGLGGGNGGTPVVTGGGGGGVVTGANLVKTTAGNFITRTATGAASVALTAGNLIPVAGDMFLNQTNAGRAIRDGGNVIEGASKDIEEKVEEVKKNAETFGQDWENNNLLKPFIDLGKNNIIVWDRFMKQQQEASEYADQMQEIVPDLKKSEPTENWVFGEDWSIEDQLEYVRQHSKKQIELPVGFATSGVSSTLFAGAALTTPTEKEPGLTSKDVQEFTKVPADMNRELRNALSGWNVKIDGRTAGTVLAPYINTELARDVP